MKLKSIYPVPVEINLRQITNNAKNTNDPIAPAHCYQEA